jgi:hypothetical protein
MITLAARSSRVARSRAIAEEGIAPCAPKSPARDVGSKNYASKNVFVNGFCTRRDPRSALL